MVYSTHHVATPVPSDVVWLTGQDDFADDAAIVTLTPTEGLAIYLASVKIAHNYNGTCNIELQIATVNVARLYIQAGTLTEWDFLPMGIPIGAIDEAIVFMHVTAPTIHIAYVIGYRMV